MTSAQLLQRLPPVPTQVEVSDDDPKIEFLPCAAGGTHYTSDAMEEDFSTSVELLMQVPRFLLNLMAISDHYDILSTKATQELTELTDTIEEFIGQWPTE